MKRAFVAALALGCASAPRPAETPAPRAPIAALCTGTLSVHFYDVGQALAALVELPDGRRVLVDAGDNPARAGCGQPCREWHDHLLTGLRNDLGTSALDLLFITHQHSDHDGGAPDVIDEFAPKYFVDNGRDLEQRRVKNARDACDAKRVSVSVIDPDHRASPIPNGAGVALTPILPSAWPASCARNPNDCSIGLRLDYCKSSILFVGDAEQPEEALLDPGGEVTLLQVGHHGSDSSSSALFLARAKPKYAVISSAKPSVGTNRSYCHPRASTVERLSAALGGPRSKTLRAFDGRVSCRSAGDQDWRDVVASDRLWATSRDGDVVLATHGDGEFERRAVAR